MEGDEGMEVQKQQVPAIGGAEYRAKESLPTTVPVIASAHLGDAMRSEGVSYPENFGVDLDTGEAYPEGTRMADSTPADDVN